MPNLSFKVVGQGEKQLTKLMTVNILSVFVIFGHRLCYIILYYTVLFLFILYIARIESVKN